MGVTFDYAEFCEIWSSIFLPGTLVPESLIAGLKKRYPLVLLSNTNEMHFEMLERTYPILRHFEKRVLSHEVGAMKPSPLIYQRRSNSPAAAPRNASLPMTFRNMWKAPAQFGIDAVQFHSATQLQEELAKRNLRWD